MSPYPVSVARYKIVAFDDTVSISERDIPELYGCKLEKKKIKEGTTTAIKTLLSKVKVKTGVVLVHIH